MTTELTDSLPAVGLPADLNPDFILFRERDVMRAKTIAEARGIAQRVAAGFKTWRQVADTVGMARCREMRPDCALLDDDIGATGTDWKGRPLNAESQQRWADRARQYAAETMVTVWQQAIQKEAMDCAMGAAIGKYRDSLKRRGIYVDETEAWDRIKAEAMRRGS